MVHYASVLMRSEAYGSHFVCVCFERAFFVDFGQETW